MINLHEEDYTFPGGKYFIPNTNLDPLSFINFDLITPTDCHLMIDKVMVLILDGNSEIGVARKENFLLFDLFKAFA